MIGRHPRRCLAVWLGWTAAIAWGITAPAAARPEPSVSADLKPSIPIRQSLPFYIAAEAGWNGLAGIGLLGGWSPHALFTIEGSLGGGTSGLRTGLRARWNVLTSQLTPFLAVGAVYEDGLDGALEYHDILSASLTNTVRQDALRGVGFQGVGGLTLTLRNGFTALLCGGYMYRIQKKPGFSDLSQGLALSWLNDAAFKPGSGFVVSGALGLAF